MDDKKDSQVQSIDLQPVQKGLKGWTNEDIASDKSAQVALEQRRGELIARLLNWSELNSVFDQYEEVANPSRRSSWWVGVTVIVVGTLALWLASLAPVFNGYEVLLGVVSAGLSVGAMVGTVYLSRLNRPKSNWLEARLVTERLRQLKHQFILSNLDLAIDAVYANEDRLWDDWGRRKRTAISEFNAKYLETANSPIQRILNDQSSDEAWMVKLPTVPTKLTKHESEVLESILDEFKLSRIDYQRNYVELKIGQIKTDPASRLRLFVSFRTLLVVVILLSTFCAGLFILQYGPKSELSIWSVAIASCSAAAAAALAFIESGTAIYADADRYEWYGAVVNRISQRWNETGSKSKKINLLVELEDAAYWEMRSFLKSHAAAKFVFT